LFGIRTNLAEGTIGWLDTLSSELIIEASEIKTTAPFFDENIITSTTGLVVSNQPGWPTGMPDNTLAYFYSQNDGGAEILVQDEEDGSKPGFAALRLEHGQFTTTLATLGSFSTALNSASEAFLIQTNSPNGVVFNINTEGSSNTAAFRFCINSDEIAQLTSNGFSLPGLSDRELRTIKSPQDGQIEYNGTIHKYCFYAGDHWEELNSRPLK
jgi:hypothetical protein